MLILGGAFFIGHGTARGQLPENLSGGTRLSLITVYPGDEIYSAFGHSAFRFQDPGSYDIVFNYGTFDADDPMFVAKFTYGKLDYKLSYSSMGALLRSAEIETRTVVEQELDLSPKSIASLYARLLENYKPENRYYRYDFLFENCSTILRDLLVDSSNDVVILDSTSTPAQSFRSLLQPYLNDRPLYDLGISMVLGSAVDRATTYDERMFLPIELLNAFASANVITRSDSTRYVRPLVPATVTLYSAGPTSLPENRDLRLVWILAGLGALWILGARRVRVRAAATEDRAAAAVEGRERRQRDIGDRILFGILGVGGVIFAFVWFISEHSVGTRNANLLWALPTHLLVAMVWRRLSARIWRPYWLFTGTLVVLVVALQPFVAQPIHPALYPVLLIILWRCSILINFHTPVTQLSNNEVRSS